MKKIIFIIISLALLTSCRQEVDLSPEQRALLLYNQGDSFSLIKNETDTLDFTVTSKEIDYDQHYNGLWNSGTYYENGNIKYNTNNTESYINQTSLKNEADGQSFTHSFLFNLGYGMTFPRYQKTSDYTLNNIVYRNCYLLTGYIDKDTMYVSTDIGILYVKSEEGDEYKLLQK